jgi:hypothetical protein
MRPPARGRDFGDNRLDTGRSMSTTPTAAPSPANRSAPARPMPEAAAVTIPILLFKRTECSFPMFCC